jgi:propanol-preferring alcohol dehydrogenase
MQALVLEAPGQPLTLQDLPRPDPGLQEVLIQVEACGVCRTDLHVLDGDLPNPKRPLILGHEIVGRVVSAGAEVRGLATGQRVGVPWLGQTCRHCRYCEAGAENLCDSALFTGYTLDGGYAEFAVADQRYVFPLTDQRSAETLAPLLCAGLIGYRALRLAGEGPRIGVYGFGAAAHIIAQVARLQGREVYAFTRPGDAAAQQFALELGCVWAGDANQTPPRTLDAAIIFAPVGALVPVALSAVTKGGTVVCAGIHMSDVPGFPYQLLWGERMIRSVANLTRRDGEEFLALAAQLSIVTHTEGFALRAGNAALAALREGRLRGAAVLIPG